MAGAHPGGSAVPPTGWVDVNGVSLHYRLEGRPARPTIVLIHEMGASLESWDEVAPMLARRYHVLRYDVRGFGGSEKLRKPVTFADESGDLRALLDRLGIAEPVTLAGSALGGAIALDFAARYPDRAAGLVAIGPAAYPDARPAAVAAADKVEANGVRSLVEGGLDMVYPAAARSTPERVSRVLGVQLAADPTSFAITVRMVGATAFRDVLPRIRCRTLFVSTSLYRGRSIDEIRQLSAMVRGAEFVTLPTGHYAALESPDQTAALIERFADSARR